jgi:cytochrome P450
LQSLPYSAQVFSEALRLYPPAWVITRKVIEEDTLLGYPLPVGSLVIISPYVVHRQPAFWEDPMEFLPDRFSSARVEKRHRFAYIPFGAGPRMCIGSRFAAVEAQLIITMVMQRFRLEAAYRPPVKVDALVTLRPSDGMQMRLMPCTKP